jgi:hypothetical protein
VLPGPRTSRLSGVIQRLRRGRRLWLLALGTLTPLAPVAAGVVDVMDIFGSESAATTPAPSPSAVTPTASRASPVPGGPSPWLSVAPSADPPPAMRVPPPGPAPTTRRTPPATTPPATPPPPHPPSEKVSSFVVHKGTWVDFDTGSPAMSDDHDAGSDVLFGPDNAYSDPARVWPDDGTATCAAQAATNGRRGYQDAMPLHDLLSAAPDGAVRACVVTTDGAVLSLRITAEKGDTWAPFRVEIPRG